MCNTTIYQYEMHLVYTIQHEKYNIRNTTQKNTTQKYNTKIQHKNTTTNIKHKNTTRQ